MSAAGELQLPQIRRLRVSFLGGENPVSGVSKNDAATTVLRGLTADEPSDADPVLDLAFDSGAFERGWLDLLATTAEPGTAESSTALPCEKWGIGSVKAWEPSIRFDLQGSDEKTPPPDSDPTDEMAFVCAGDPKKHGLATEKADTCFWAFLEALEASESTGVAAFEKVHIEQFEEAEQKPRELIRRDAPCPGITSTFARHSPEAADYIGCGTVVMHVFDPGFWPWGNFRNVAMICVAVPNIAAHKSLKRGGFHCALRAVASNLVRTVREYNRVASKAGPAQSRERQMWWQADLRGRAECLLSDMNCRADALLQKIIRKDPDGWIDVDVLKGFAGGDEDLMDAEFIDSLSSSTLVETKMSDDAVTRLVRRAGNKTWEQSLSLVAKSAPAQPPDTLQSWDGGWDDGGWDGGGGGALGIWSPWPSPATATTPGQAWLGAFAVVAQAAGFEVGKTPTGEMPEILGKPSPEDLLYHRAKDGVTQPLWRQFAAAGKAAAQREKAEADLAAGVVPAEKDPRLDLVAAWRLVERERREKRLDGKSHDWIDISVSKIVMSNAPRSSDLRSAAASKHAVNARIAANRPAAPGPNDHAANRLSKGKVVAMEEDEPEEDNVVQAGSRFAIYGASSSTAASTTTPASTTPAAANAATMTPANCPMMNPPAPIKQVQTTPIPTVPGQPLPASRLKSSLPPVQTEAAAPVLRKKRLGPVGVILEGDRPPMGSNLKRDGDSGEASAKQARPANPALDILSPDDAKAAMRRNKFLGW
eukprot:TRINITY_DN80758_c0_g1_i1.p1 TRINITY_DN80758_c0_g1~~TRINITY_DN80758_c0_g1_i1.p1  ORF type:complete len:781 (+),score=130.87 TRINITY_DN80758_c0_g1_i1:62-2344(+)